MNDISPTPLADRTALITGGSGGIGTAVALRLADAGARIALVHSSHGEDAENTATRINTLHGSGRAVTLQADLSEATAAAELVDRTSRALGAVDLLIAGAGIGEQLAWADIDVDTWDTTMAVNVRAPFLMAQAALPGMIERGWGRVLFVSSIAALNGGIIGPHYAASKAALHGLTHSLAVGVAAAGVTVNALAPALIGGTRILPADAGEGGKLPAPIPVGRLGTPDEVAAMAASMVTNGYLTNKVITLDGGLYPR
ncbi:SDR family NAD(P)-dependent oxidoreductase [Streptomyces aquilus]|uniref:SDR family NAD(P)-dependent oxidoreductase n=1 Tax=Streptomyces aquilus TaxID=2548456 RepID=A0A3Q9C6B2_9ACTN|nr:SDR family NAD(P)-dependent oxidoreductase [Streptomyces aquilus]AZP22720.1 SDR family NAD(P)-dependent oxidoreductase [Streptomyces aquilus]